MKRPNKRNGYACRIGFEKSIERFPCSCDLERVSLISLIRVTVNTKQARGRTPACVCYNGIDVHVNQACSVEGHSPKKKTTNTTAKPAESGPQPELSGWVLRSTAHVRTRTRRQTRGCRTAGSARNIACTIDLTCSHSLSSVQRSVLLNKL